jgi:putative transposase
MVSAQARRSQVEFASHRGISVRRACALVGVARSTMGYELKMPAKDGPVMTVMRDLSSQYPRYGYRRIHIFLARSGHEMSPDRAHRLWQLAGLQVPRKRRRRRVASSRPRPVPALEANQVWAYDFVFDACANGQQLKCLTVIDEHTRESLAIDVAGSIRSGPLIEVLTKLVSEHGAPKYLRSDNGPEFVSKAALKWLLQSNIDTALIDPGKPWQNGADESFNGKFRDECLSMEWFRNRTEAKIVIENWRRHYNEVRPHSSLSYQTPVEFKSKRSSTNPNGAILQQ